MQRVIQGEAECKTVESKNGLPRTAVGPRVVVSASRLACLPSVVRDPRSSGMAHDCGWREERTSRPVLGNIHEEAGEKEKQQGNAAEMQVALPLPDPAPTGIRHLVPTGS